MDVITPQESEIQTPDIQSEKRRVLILFVKLGLFILSIFTFRILAGVVGALLIRQIMDLSPDGRYAVLMGMNFVFLQVLPLIVGKLLFNTSSVRQMMKKPPRMSKAMGYFPAVYGFGYLMNIIVVIVTFLFFREQALSDTVIVYDSLYIDSPLQVVFLVSYVVILAPLFEEIIYRGIVFEGLKPVGTVFAIFISGFCFALMHANFKQFFFALPIGLLLAYLTYATKSILPGIFIHIIINALGAGAIVLNSVSSMSDIHSEPTVLDNALNTIFMFYIILMLILVAAGIASLIKKLRVIRRYKIPRESQLSVGKRVVLMFASTLFPISVLLFMDFFFQNRIITFLQQLILT